MKKFIRLHRIEQTLFGGLLLFFNIYTQAQNPHGIITIKAGVVLNIGKKATFVTNSNIDNRGTLTNAGTIVLNGNSGQSFPGTSGSIPLMNILEVKNTGAGITLNQGIKIKKELRLTSGNLALGNYDITIQSDSVQTAAVSAIGAGAGVSYGTGKFVVERFIKVGTTGHGKSWQFLSVPANGQTIRNCWQEAGAASVGYGTQLTNPLGTAAGYDLSTPGTSIKTYVSATNSYDQGPSSTSALINNTKGYMLFVRGDRTVASGSGTVPTILRIKGTLFTPASPPPALSITGGKFESVGNPYASQIDFTQLTRTGGVDNIFYTWDPTLAGSYGVGGYQTISATNAWVSVPGGGNYAGVHKNIESGQAFFVHSTATTGTIGFTENAKTGASKLLNRNATGARLTTTRQFMRSTLLTNTGTIADGNATAFDTNLSNAVDGDDALKIINGGENFGLKRDSSILAIEGRKLIATTDTLFYFTNHLQQQTYTILLVPENMDQTKNAWLVDNFLQMQTPVSLNDSNRINFNVTTDPLSSQTDRFMLVFAPQNLLAVSATTLHAVRNIDGTIAVNWKTTAENNIKKYVVEKSVDDITFNAIGTKDILINNGAEATYIFKDEFPFAGNNFYRIKIEYLNGAIKYSEVVKIAIDKIVSGISLYPNPTVGRSLNFYFDHQFFGNYNIKLVNQVGQTIWASKIFCDNNIGRKFTVELPKNIAAGKYHLSLSGNGGKSFKTYLILL